MLDEDVDPPVPFERQAPTGRKAAVIGSGPAGMAAAYYLLIAGHDVTVFERDPAPGGMLRYGIPQYRLPKVEVLEAEYESVTRLGGTIVCDAALGRDFTLDDLTNQGFGAVLVAIGCYDTNKLGIPGEDAAEVLDGLEYLRTATLGLPYPDHAGKRVVVIGGGLHLDGLLAHVGPPGRRRGHARLPPRHEGHARRERVHEAIEEGVTAIFQAGPVRVVTDKAGNVTGVEFIRMRSANPMRPAGVDPSRAGHRVHDPLRPRPAGDRPGAGARLDRAARQRGRDREAFAAAADAVTFSTAGRACSAPATCASARRPWSRPSPRAARVCRRRLPQGNGPRRDPHPPDARRAAARVPLDRALHGEVKAALPDEGDARRGAQPQLRRVRAAVHARGGDGRVDALQCTCEAIGFCDLRRLGIEYGTTLKTLEPQYHQGAGYRSVTENRFTGTTTTTSATLPRVHPARAVALHRLRALRQRLRRGRRAACYDFMRIGFDTLVTTPLDMSLNDTPCVSCGRCAETCPGADAKPRVLEKYEVDESRCILCGICVDACPYDALRDGADIELAPDQPRTADDRPHGDLGDRTRDRGDLHPARGRLGDPGRSGGSPHRRRAAAAGAAGDDHRPAVGERPAPAGSGRGAGQPDMETAGMAPAATARPQ